MTSEFTCDIIRTLVHGTKLQERERSRNELFNKGRNLEHVTDDKKYKEFDVTRLVKDLKRSANKEGTLSSLKLAFIQNRTNMITFLRIEGAVHSLIGNLISQDPIVQLLAAECCCNLSLGDSKTCYQLAKAAGPYLVTILKGLNYNLMNYSLLTLGNICATSKKSLKLIKSQGALQAFEHTIAIPQLRDSTAFALVLYTKSVPQEEFDELVGITKSILPYVEESISIQWFLFHLTTAEVTRSILIENHVAERIISHLDSFEDINRTNIQSTTCLLRVVANLCTETSGEIGKIILDQWQIFLAMVKRFLVSDYRHLRAEIAWLYGNLINHACSHVKEGVLREKKDLDWLAAHLI